MCWIAYLALFWSRSCTSIRLINSLRMAGVRSVKAAWRSVSFKNPKCNSPHIMDADLLMQTIAEVLKKIEDYSISNRAEFEALVKKNLAMQQTDQTKKQQKRIPQITTRLEQIDKVLNKLYEDNALGTIPQDRYEQMSQKYSEEYLSLIHI